MIISIVILFIKSNLRILCLNKKNEKFKMFTAILSNVKVKKDI